MEAGDLSDEAPGTDGCPIWAHTLSTTSGQRHRLEEHLRSVAWWAAEFAEPFGAGQPARWLGLTHDFGKAAPGWQQRLLEVEGTDQPVGIDHRAAGTRFLVERLDFDAFALPVYGHHGGLQHPGEMENFLASPPLDIAHERQAIQRLQSLLPELRDPTPPIWPSSASDLLGGEMLTRMLFSALVDADHLDTQVHFGKRRQHVTTPVSVAQLLDRFEDGLKAKLKKRKASPSPVDPLRIEVYEACVAAARLAPGFFKLAAPTGLGKTISSAGFALHHMVARGLRRVIVAVPFISITEQNAAEYRELLSSTPRDPVVLEHHSSVTLDGAGSRWQRLAAENWDAPFIVTTTVQLLQSLHDRRPWAMRKLHRLANSVIVLDEIQALPVHLLIPILTILRQLVDHFGVTVLLSSATQPEFWEMPPLREARPVEILPNPTELQQRLRRLRPMRYRWLTAPRPTLEQVAQKATQEPQKQVLIVVNTVDHARKVYQAVCKGQPDPAAVQHLSTRMCPAHRQAVLKNVTAILKQKPVQPLYLVSTQLIEAGVDLDFPVVYRAMAPAESILQAAGRANREGLRAEGGLVVIFDPVEQAMPSSYGLPVAETRRLFGSEKSDPDDLPTLACYFRSYYGTLPDKAMGADILAARESWNFPVVTENFRMIDDDTVPVVVRYENPKADTAADPIDTWLQSLRRDPGRGHVWLRRLQPYTISLPKSLAAKPHVASLLRPVIGDLHEWAGNYDLNTGIVIPTNEETSHA
ncbi:CRISPR-associated helicase Cas3' [Streptosporangium sp. NPDC001682]